MDNQLTIQPITNQTLNKHSQEHSETNDISDIRQNCSIDSVDVFIDQINSKTKKYWSKYVFGKIMLYCQKQKQKQANLCLALASKMPKGIRSQVTKMIEYYEDHLGDQIDLIHKLVGENKKLKNRLEKYQTDITEDKDKQNEPNNSGSLDLQSQKNQRIDQLERSLIDKNRQIGELNKQVTNLILQVKKYKKKACELQAKSPVKPDRSKSPVQTIASNNCL